MAAALSTLERFLMRWTLRVAMLLLALMSCVSFYQVVTRFLFEQPSTWSEVVARTLSIWMVYLGVAVAFRTGALMSVDYVIERLRGGARALLVMIIFGTSLGVLLVLVWYGIDMAQRVQFQTLAGVYNPFTGLPLSISIVYAAAPTGAALAIIGLLARTVEQLRESVGAGKVPTNRELFEI
ncbi:TRAP transporter small permease [Arenibaculum sp.]|uniref:TRAP transporter small permease n=1 Tax=Arenibaculum sp. TaxID=2865862 RepID=UPI002E0D79AD|nr:TRAP transporter small permease subunit [Arenibaculum sp.]